MSTQGGRWGRVVVVLVVSCGSETGRPDPLASSTPSNGPAATSTVSVASPPTATGTTSMTPSAVSPSKVAPRTGRPSLAAWCRAPQIHYLSGRGEADPPPCGYIEVAEWIMVACPQSHPLGNYDRALPGGGSIATPEEVAVGPQVGNKDAVVISLRPGTTAKPLFFYRPVEHPTWSKELTYSFSMPQSGTSLGDRDLPTVFSSVDRDTSGCDRYETVAPPEQQPSAQRDLKEFEEPKTIDDVADQPPAPSDDAWKAEKQVLVSGSDALGCETKLKDQWFRTSCEGKVSFTAAEVEREGRKTQTKVEVSDGKLSILTPYVEKTDFRVKVTFQGGERFFKLRWPAGKRPLEVGKFSDSR